MSKVAWRSRRHFDGFRSRVNSFHLGRFVYVIYTVSHRECGQFRHCLLENFEKFEMISTPTGSWIRSSRRRDRIQLPVVAEIISNFSKFSSRQWRNCPLHTLDGTRYSRNRLYFLPTFASLEKRLFLGRSISHDRFWHRWCVHNLWRFAA